MQVDPRLIQGDDVMPLACHLYREDAQELTGHVEPDPLLLGGHKMADSSQIPNCKAKRVRQVPVHSGSRKAGPSGELAYRRKRIIRKIREDSVIDRARLDDWRFGRGSIFLGGELRTASVFGDRGVGHCIRPERAHKIFTDGIERHPLHAEIEDDRLLVHWKNESDHPLQTSFGQKKPASERTGMNFKVVILVNIHTVALSWSSREREHPAPAGRSMLHLMWDTLESEIELAQ
jgi:hypothetical protein